MFAGLTRPSFNDLKTRVLTALSDNLPETNVYLDDSLIKALADAFTLSVNELYGYIDKISDQANVLYCLDENLPIHGQIWGVQPDTPVRASGTVNVTVTGFGAGTAATLIPQSTFFTSQDGLLFTPSSSIDLINGVNTVPIVATDRGSKYNKPTIATPFTLVQPIPFVNSLATGSTSGGSDRTADISYRQRILARIADAPSGGNLADYKKWAFQYFGVTRVWVTSNANARGAGTIDVRFCIDDTLHTNGIPTVPEVAAVQAIIDKLKPTNCNVLVIAPTATPLNITISGLTPNTPVVQSNILASLRSLFLLSGCGKNIRVSDIWQAIAESSGVDYFLLTSPTVDTFYTNAQLPVVGTISYV